MHNNRILAVTITAATILPGCASARHTHRHATPKAVISTTSKQSADVRRINSPTLRPSEIGPGFEIIPLSQLQQQENLDPLTTPPETYALATMHLGDIRAIRVCHGRTASFTGRLKINRPVYVKWAGSPSSGSMAASYIVATIAYPNARLATREFAELKHFVLPGRLCPRIMESPTRTNHTEWLTHNVTVGTWTGINAMQTLRVGRAKLNDATIDSDHYLIRGNEILAAMYSQTRPNNANQVIGASQRLLNLLITRLG